MRTLLVNNYDSYADLLAYTLWCVGGVRPTVVYNDAFTADALLARNFDRIVLSPDPGHPGAPRDFGVCAEVIARSTVPLLGVCLGHQGIALAHGGTLALAPKVKHGKRSVIKHNGTHFSRASQVCSRPCAITHGWSMPRTCQSIYRCWRAHRMTIP